MMKYVMLLIVATLAAAVFALADVVGKVENTAHAQAGTPSNVSATNGANPGEAEVSWDPVAGASAYRVGWLAVPDYQANIDNDRWRERFAYSDVNANSSYTVTRLTPGVAYYLITGRKQGNDIVWSAWATLTLNSGALSCPTQPAVAPSTTSALLVASGSNPGEVVVSWDLMAGTTGYRVGWLAVPDYQANIDNDRWRERFAYSDINTSSSYTVTRLTPGIAYYFILGRKQGDDITWSQWAVLALNSDPAACPDVGPTTGTSTPRPTPTFPASAVGGDYDHDNDGLIEVRTLAQLNVIRLDRDGDSLVDVDDLPEYLDAFPGALDDMGCPADGCKGYELAASLDFDTNGNGEADAGDAYWNDGTGWEPIRFGERSQAPDGNNYKGTFDGNGFAIANLYIDRPDASPVGLFSYNIGTIQNLVLYDVDVTGRGCAGDSCPYYETPQMGGVGSLVGFNRGTVNGSTASGVVAGKGSVGGLVGLNGNGTISNSAAGSDVSGSNYVGGLVGLAYPYGDISNCVASGDVSGNGFENSNLGGLVGHNQGDISNCAASGDVSGQDHVGGFVGDNRGAISSSTASGNVSGNYNNVGGLAGYNYYGTIDESAASGDVSGNNYVGGLVGLNEGNISGSTASGNVSGDYNNAGGLVGFNGLLDGSGQGNISGSAASGTVSGNNNVGGLVGQHRFSGTISGSAASGAVSGNHRIGGLVGYNNATVRSHRTTGAIDNCKASGTVTGDDYVGGLVGENAATISGGAANGTVSGNDYVGGLAGKNWNTISASKAEGDATGRFYVGGLVGINVGTIENSTARGNVAGVRFRGVLVGANDGGTITNSTGTGTVTAR